MSLASAADRLLQGAVTTGDVPGVVAVVTDRQGEIYKGAFGEREAGTGVAMTTDTVCWLASMTKAVASTAVMCEVERGGLDLDAPAGDLVPYLADVLVLEGFDDDGAPVTRPARGAITLRQLLTHTAGFSYPIWDPTMARYAKATGTPEIGSGEMAALRVPLVSDPGDAWNYGVGIDWAGLVLEAATGRRFRDYLSENVLEPLGMNSTAFVLDEDMRRRRATVHQRLEDGILEPRPNIIVRQDPEFDGAGGGLYSTAEDYAKFTRMILNQGSLDGVRVLKPETVAMMSVNQMGACRVRQLVSTDKARSLDAEFFPGVEKTWSVGFMINEEEAPSGRSAGSLAWAGLSNCYHWIDPMCGLGGVYLTQILPFVDSKSLPLFLELESLVYDNVGRS
jgi:CubicO group peptidase (beta-lactamase class C family)